MQHWRCTKLFQSSEDRSRLSGGCNLDKSCNGPIRGPSLVAGHGILIVLIATMLESWIEKQITTYCCIFKWLWNPCESDTVFIWMLRGCTNNRNLLTHLVLTAAPSVSSGCLPHATWRANTHVHTLKCANTNSNPDTTLHPLRPLPPASLSLSPGM